MLDNGHALAVLPVYGYDHGNLVFAAGDPSGCFSDPWDSGLAGLIYASPADVELVGCPVDRLVEALTAEVQEYSRWSEGDCYGYVVERLVPACAQCGAGERWEDADEMNSCGGFIGQEYAEEAALEALRSYL